MELERQTVRRRPAHITEPVTQKRVQDEAGYRTPRHEHESFREKLTRYLKTVGSDRFADCHLPLAADASHQQKPSYVGAGNQGHHSRHAEEHHEKNKESALVSASGRIPRDSTHRSHLGELPHKIFAGEPLSCCHERLPRLIAGDTIAQSSEK